MILDTPEQIDTYRFTVLIHTIKGYLNLGLLPHRSITPKRMRDLATEYTGNAYPRSKKGLETALTELETLKRDHLDPHPNGE